jgi:anti-sigma factor RsiW
VPQVDAETRSELEATLAARQELGPAHDEELIDGFLDRIDKEIDRRVEEKVAALVPRKRAASPLNPATLAVSIPIIAIAGGIGHVAGLIVAFLALVIVFTIAEFRR